MPLNGKLPRDKIGYQNHKVIRLHFSVQTKIGSLLNLEKVRGQDGLNPKNLTQGIFYMHWSHPDILLNSRANTWFLGILLKGNLNH